MGAGHSLSYFWDSEEPCPHVIMAPQQPTSVAIGFAILRLFIGLCIILKTGIIMLVIQDTVLMIVKKKQATKNSNVCCYGDEKQYTV